MKLFRKFLPLFWFLSGLLSGVPLLFSHAGILSFFFHVPFFLLLIFEMEKDRPRLVGRSFLFVFGFQIMAFRFFTAMFPFSFIEGLSPFLALLLLLFLWGAVALLQTLFFLPGIVAFRFLRKAPLLKKQPLLLPLLFASLYTVSEWLQNFTWMGVPWGTLAVSVADNLPFLQNASLLGHFFLTFLILAVNGYLALALRRSLSPSFSGKARLFPLALAAAILLSTHATGALLLIPNNREEEEEVKVAVIQINMASLMDEDFSNAEVLECGERLVRAAVADGAEVIVWSETAFTSYFPNSYYSLRLSELSEELSVVQYVGARGRNVDEDGTRMPTNAVYRIDENGNLSETVYDKQRLVPFGEYVPWREFFEATVPFMLELLTEGALAPGNTTDVFTDGETAVGALVCFDSIYGTLARESARNGASYLVLGTNDIWFRGSEGLRTHKMHAVLRAVENGRYVARAAGTGISAVITDHGEILAETAPDVATYAIASLSPRTHTTLYTAVGDLFVLAAALFVLGVALSPLSPYAHTLVRRLTHTLRRPPRA